MTPAPRVAAADAAVAERFDWGTIQWLVSGRQLPDSQLTFGHVTIAPGARNVRHYHPNCDEVLFVIEGELDHSLGDEVFQLRPGSAIHIPTGIHHDAVNTGTTTAWVVVAYSTGDRQTVFVGGATAE